MRYPLLAAVVSLGLIACGGSQDAKSAADVQTDWSTFSGKYSDTASPRHARAEKADKGEVAAKESAAKAKEAPVEKEEAPALPSTPAPKSSRGMVKGESLSSVSLDMLGEAATTGTKSKLVSSGIVTGTKYETLTVETKKGTIKITRPAASPNPSGPDVTAPKAKSADLPKTTASWYDEDADVLVTVTTPKGKSAAQKTLGAVVKR
ncbi:MAG: hypothetical protein KIT84_02680 [Labilithrix sp.]|nr:hypothetical protein [Labilithrix sp.]MCW5809886.1 hypothetical protein [Labilithrix sp.]